MKINILIKFIILNFAFLIFLSGCASVQPWEKEVLSDPIMKFISEQGSSEYEQHLLNSREASSGGYGGSGGGCGCK